MNLSRGFEEQRLDVQDGYLNVEYERQWFCLKRQTAKVFGKREISISVPDVRVINNRIETSKYNYVTFLPKNLLVQFSKLANIYFVVIGIFQMIPIFSVTNGQPLVYFPLFVVIVISMIKDFFEDRKRNAQDELENNSIAWKLQPELNNFVQVKWEELHIGDIIRVQKEDKFPADILLLGTSQEKGTCYIETKNLDGETNLKHRQSCSAKLFQNQPDFSKEENLGRFRLTYEDPNCEIHRFNGILIDKADKEENASSSNRCLLGNQNLCLRGCLLKRTPWVTGVVIYTGHDCKSLKYTSIPKYKFGTAEKKMNSMVVEVFCILLCINAFSATYYAIWFNSHYSELKYLQLTYHSVIENLLLHIPVWLLLLNTFVPISLLVTLEIVKYLQGQTIQRDQTFQNFKKEFDPVGVSSSNLLDELGAVRYILTDKTGTLTSNSMKFKALSLQGEVYEHSKYDDNGILVSDELIAKIADPAKNHLVFELFICMNLCHSLIVEDHNGKKSYSGTSSDEECIMEFCVAQGIFYEGIDENKIMNVFSVARNTRYAFRVIGIREYSSDLGKMSILVEDLQDKTFKIYTKGAASKIFAFLRADQEETQIKTETHVDRFAANILRTLCYSYRELTAQEVATFIQTEKQLTEQSHVINMEAIQQQLFTPIEDQQVLLGGSGVNDEFSDEVDSTLKNLKAAGIRIWMITGDKRETGLSVASKCNIIEQNSVLQILDDWKNKDIQYLTDAIQECNSLAEKSIKFCLAISGVSLARISNLPDTILLDNLAKAMKSAESVVAYHFTPMQKAQLLQLLKKLVQKETILAIGDGANDVSMIQAASVGVGIRGKEGREAAKSADFTISDFKHLNRLLLYIGQESYRKNSHTIFFNFYKNQAWNLAYFWYNFSCGQSGAFIYDQWIAQLYNLFYVALPIIIYALFDEIFPTQNIFSIKKNAYNLLEKMPQRYKDHAAQPYFNHVNFWKWFGHGSAHSLVTVYAAFFIFGANSDQQQRPIDIFTQGMHAFTSCVIVCNLKVLQLHRTHYPFSLLSIFGSIIFYVISMAILSKFNGLNAAGVFKPIFGTLNSYLGFAFVIFLTYGIDQAYLIFKDRYNVQCIEQNENSQKSPKNNEDVIAHTENELSLSIQMQEQSPKVNDISAAAIKQSLLSKKQKQEELQINACFLKQLNSNQNEKQQEQQSNHSPQISDYAMLSNNKPMPINPVLKLPFSSIEENQTVKNEKDNQK